jgi:hypothetical protein
MNRRAKALPQYMEALRAKERVGFSRLSRIEAGLQSAESCESNAGVARVQDGAADQVRRCA